MISVLIQPCCYGSISCLYFLSCFHLFCLLFVSTITSLPTLSLDCCYFFSFLCYTVSLVSFHSFSPYLSSVFFLSFFSACLCLLLFPFSFCFHPSLFFFFTVTALPLFYTFSFHEALPNSPYISVSGLRLLRIFSLFFLGCVFGL